MSRYDKWKPGDVLWVREAWRSMGAEYSQPRYLHRATCSTPEAYNWRPSIHLPKAGCRLFLELVAVKRHSATAQGMFFKEEGFSRPLDFWQKVEAVNTGRPGWEGLDTVGTVLIFTLIPKPAEWMTEHMGPHHPILFQDDMVRAILGGKKTQTWRMG